MIALIWLINILIPLPEDGNKNWIIVDRQSNEPIAYAHIYTQDYMITAVSNTQGKFLLSHIPGNNDTIAITSVGYQRMAVTYAELLQMDTVFIKKDTIYLHPVTVTNLSARQMVAKAISKIPENYFNSYQMNGTMQASIAIDTSIIYSGNVPVVIAFDEYSQPDKATVAYENNHSLVQNFIKKSDSLDLQQSLQFDHLLTRRGFLNIENMDEWEYDCAGNLIHSREEIMVIKIKHKQNGSRINHTAEVFINLENYAIVRCQFNYQWDKKSLTRFKKRANHAFPFLWSGNFIYKKNNQAYQLYQYDFQLSTLFFANINLENVRNLYVEWKPRIKNM